ncbi:MAG: hypothetical protein ACKOJF_28600, partial [Planctomycetaceae bacterium]
NPSSRDPASLEHGARNRSFRDRATVTPIRRPNCYGWPQNPGRVGRGGAGWNGAGGRDRHSGRNLSLGFLPTSQ